MKRLIVLAAVSFLSFPIAGAHVAPRSAPPEEERWTLTMLMDQRAQVQLHRALFTELRRSVATGVTRSSSGSLLYEAPDRLERETSRPFFEHFVLVGDQVTLDTETEPGFYRRREMKLRELPAAQPALVALRAVFAGDLVTLERHFDARLSGAENAWQLILIPKERAFGQYVRHITLSGKSTVILAVETRARNGDSTRTLLTSNLAERN